jgi:hypothetical protein
MPEDNDSKVVSIFQRHKRGEHYHIPVEEGGELIISPDGINYVSFRSDRGEIQMSEDDLWDVSSKKHYIVKMLESHKNGEFRLDHYHVSALQLEPFLKTIDQRPGKLLGIEPFFPETTA